MRRGPYTKVLLRNSDLLVQIQNLKADHPFWGYRRMWAHLKFIDKMPVNKKRVYRTMDLAGLLVKDRRKLRASRTPLKAKPKATRPNQWWGIDMTKILVSSFGWIYVVIVLDWYTKKIVGYHIGIRALTADWLAAVDMAVNRQFPEGVRGHELHMMSDNGCQPTSRRFIQTCAELDIHQAFTSYNNPKGNADTERIMRTLKEECLWLKEWVSPFQLGLELSAWIEGYNRHYQHSTLGYVAPAQFEQRHLANPETQQKAA